MKKNVAWTAVIVLLVLGTGLALVTGELPALRRLFGSASFTKSVDVKSPGEDRATYYRLKVNLAYKDEPLDFDIVVGCHVRISTYKDSDRTVEVGIAPMAYGLKMKDGRGVVVRPPDACKGETTQNGGVPNAMLPLVVTYESADEPWIGLAYASDDAYDSPRSELKFLGATINRATRDEWQEWRRTEAPKNFVTYELLGINERNRWEKPRWKPGYRAMGSICGAVSRVRLPEPVREAIRSYWPTSKPKYWYPNESTRQAFYAAGDFDGKKGVLFDGNPLSARFPAEAPLAGQPRRAPGAMIFYKSKVASDVYPATSDRSLNRLDTSGQLSPEVAAKPKKSWAEANIDPQLKGFANCDVVNNIDGVPVSPGRFLFANRIDGEPISEELDRVVTNFNYAFEADEYVIFYEVYPMVNFWGGL